VHRARKRIVPLEQLTRPRSGGTRRRYEAYLNVLLTEPSLAMLADLTVPGPR